MKKSQRQLLSRLMSVCNDMGGDLDGTSTSDRKYRDRQRALMDVYKVIYHGVFCDDPENPNLMYDLQIAEEKILALEELSKKVYPDRQGYLKPEEKS